MMRTTSFGGTSPEVFLEKVVRSETECIIEMHCVRRTRWERGGGVEGLREGEPIRRLDYFGFGRNWCLFSDYFTIIFKWSYSDRHHPRLSALSALCSSSRRNFNWLRVTREQVRGAVPRRHIPPLLSQNIFLKYRPSRFARALQKIVPVPYTLSLASSERLRLTH